MKTSVNSAAALLALSSVASAAGHSHANVFGRRHFHHPLSHPERALEERAYAPGGGKCAFPHDAGLVPVTPDQQNAGWAMSPDQPCTPGKYCPYACPPGQVMAQWDPKATTYSYPESMNGGLFCDGSGNIHKPFPNKPYCVEGTGALGCKNNAEKDVAFCQTVLPGNEAMLIPTNIKNYGVLAVPDTSYWAGTAAHYYINPPGYSTEEACVWGTKEKPIGNWSPYVAGANTVANGLTFVKLGWNPIYLEPATPFRSEMPNWGVKIECEGSGCNGMPCMIDPDTHKVNECSGSNTPGAGGATFCVVTVPKGAKANVVIFEKGGADQPVGAIPSQPESPPQPPAPKPKPHPKYPHYPQKPKPEPSTTCTTSTTPPAYQPTPPSNGTGYAPPPPAEKPAEYPTTTSPTIAYSPHVFVEKPAYTPVESPVYKPVEKPVETPSPTPTPSPSPVESPQQVYPPPAYNATYKPYIPNNTTSSSYATVSTNSARQTSVSAFGLFVGMSVAMLLLDL